MSMPDYTWFAWTCLYFTDRPAHQTVTEKTGRDREERWLSSGSECVKEKVRGRKERRKRWGDRGMQTGHAMTGEERMFRETENGGEGSGRENRRRKQELRDRPGLSSVLTPVWDGGRKQGRWKECLHSKKFLLRGLLISRCTPPLLLLTLRLWPIASTCSFRDFLTGRRRSAWKQWEWEGNVSRWATLSGFQLTLTVTQCTRTHMHCVLSHTIEFGLQTKWAL